MEKLHGYTLEYWKNKAEKDYPRVPISVLKYIICLEERIEQLTVPAVVEQSEQLKTFCEECSEPVEEKKQIIICQDCWDVKQSF